MLKILKLKVESGDLSAFFSGAGARMKASRPLIRVLVINDNDLWINNFIRDNEHSLIHGKKDLVMNVWSLEMISKARTQGKGIK